MNVIKKAFPETGKLFFDMKFLFTFASRSLTILIKKGGGTEPCETLATIPTQSGGGRC